MALAALNTIVQVGNGRWMEGEADSAISPGEAIEMAADGTWDPAVSAKAEYGEGGLYIATEDALQGKVVGDAFADGDKLQIYIPVPGDEISVLVKSGEDIAIGDQLVVEGGGSGLFIEAAAGDLKDPCVALESSGGALGANALVRVRVH